MPWQQTAVTAIPVNSKAIFCTPTPRPTSRLFFTIILTHSDWVIFHSHSPRWPVSTCPGVHPSVWWASSLGLRRDVCVSVCTSLWTHIWLPFMCSLSLHLPLSNLSLSLSSTHFFSPHMFPLSLPHPLSSLSTVSLKYSRLTWTKGEKDPNV